jgi:glucan phosphoethanolaminetransferase (alkaline phosphatase superfamily)
MKRLRNPLLLTLFLGGVIGYIAACNNAKPTTDANAASENQPEKEAAANDADSSSAKEAADPSAKEPVVVAQAVTNSAPAATAAAAPADGKRPNIVVIWGDDIGESNISAYNFGLMGYQTPNIDRLAREGMMFTDMYADQSCTAGRSSGIVRQT